MSITNTRYLETVPDDETFHDRNRDLLFDFQRCAHDLTSWLATSTQNPNWLYHVLRECAGA